MIYFIRHSARLDYEDMKKWEKMERFKENESDPPLSKDGEKIALQQIEKIMNDKYDTDEDIDFIYSSPFARCIETAIIFRKYILKKYKINVKIRIDYGLSPQFPGDFIYWFGSDNSNIIIKNGKFIQKTTPKFLDNDMMQKEIYKKYNSNNFDIKYESKTLFDNINKIVSYQDSVNDRLESINKIANILSGFSIVCTHGEVIMLIKNFLEKEWQPDRKNLFGGRNYCGGIECKKTKTKLLLNEIINGNLY